MIDFANIEKYKENNRIEAKKALGGLPRSIWETYSAFANAYGGIILLGVEEHRDKTLHPVDLPDPEGMIREFWVLVNDPKKVSINVLSGRDVYIQEVDGKRIVVINVPRAKRFDRPVYIDGSTVNSYRRSGDGDYRCTREEIEGMLRDAAARSQDMRVLEGVGPEALDQESICRYRERMLHTRPGQGWETLAAWEFLLRLGALGKGADGLSHPTAAGLLLFGYEKEIVREFPEYCLDFETESETVPAVQALAGAGGNLYDFYFRVHGELTRSLLPLEQHQGNIGSEYVSVSRALGEALANSLINADYHGKGGVVVRRLADEIIISNPGGFRIRVEEARNGGVSDPRNAALMQMFMMIDIGRRTGGGIPNIYNVWRRQGWPAPVIREGLAPERITLILPVGRDVAGTKQTGRPSCSFAGSAVQKAAVIQYLTEHVAAKCSEIAVLLGVKDRRARQLLAELIAAGVVIPKGDGRGRVYKLKE